MDPDRQIQRTSVVDEVAARVQADILNKRYQPGDVLPPERDLATTYGVTRTSLKHALVRLEQRGLILTRHGVGSIVQPLEESGGADLLRHLTGSAAAPEHGLIAEILEARSAVAVAFTRLAATRRSPDELTRMHALIESLAAVPDSDVRAVQKLELELVRLWARASRNRAFQLLANSVSAAYRLDLAPFAAPFADRRWLMRRLRAVVAAMAARDADQTAAAATLYFDESARRILGSWRK